MRDRILLSPLDDRCLRDHLISMTDFESPLPAPLSQASTNSGKRKTIVLSHPKKKKRRTIGLTLREKQGFDEDDDDDDYELRDG